MEVRIAIMGRGAFSCPFFVRELSLSLLSLMFVYTETQELVYLKPFRIDKELFLVALGSVFKFVALLLVHLVEN